MGFLTERKKAGLSQLEVAKEIGVSVILLAAGMFAPAIASLLTRLITKEGFKNMYLRPNFKGHIRHYVLLWFAPTVLLFLRGTFPFDGNLSGVEDYRG